jgi:hypothetical protein
MSNKKVEKKIKATVIERICYNCFYFSTEYYDEDAEMSVCVNYRSHKYCMQSTSVNKCDFFKFMPIIAGR